MCCLFACFNKKPDLQLLIEAHETNDDGAGVSWIDKGRVQWKKGIKDPHIVHDLIKNLPFPLGIHFRTASVGPPIPELTQPFPITERAGVDLRGSAAAVLFHNGTFSKWKELSLRWPWKLPEGELSDTRMMAWAAAHRGLNILKLVDQKLLLMTSRPPHMYTFNEPQWHKHDPKDGFYQSSSVWSHTGYDTRRYLRPHSAYDPRWKDHYGGMEEEIEAMEASEMGGVCDLGDGRREDMGEELGYSIVGRRVIEGTKRSLSTVTPAHIRILGAGSIAGERDPKEEGEALIVLPVSQTGSSEQGTSSPSSPSSSRDLRGESIPKEGLEKVEVNTGVFSPFEIQGMLSDLSLERRADANL